MDSPEQFKTNIELINLNQEFTLLDPKRTNFIKHPTYLPYSNASTQIILESGTLPNFPIDIVVLGGMGGRYSKGFVLTPFNPEIGNSIVLEDLNPETRLKRLLENKVELEERLDSPLASHLITIQTGIRSVRMLGMDPDQDKFNINPEFIEDLEKLRLLLAFPKGLYLAMPNPNLLVNGIVDFGFFYPADTGQLPIQEVKPKDLQFFVAEGFPLLVPFDKSQLETIKGRFIIQR